MKNKQSAAKVQPKSTSKVATTPKVSLAEMLKERGATEKCYRVSIPIQHILDFDPQNPDCETVLIMGSPRKVVRWNVEIGWKKATAVFQVGQIARLYDSILKENLPEGVSLSDEEQAVVVMTDRFTVNQRGQKNPNGSAGFLNLSPLTVKNSSAVENVSGFQFAE